VKVSAHGAQFGMYEPLYRDYCRRKKTIAVLSVGPNGGMHPHPRVLEVLKESEIRTYSTCWPSTSSLLAGRPVTARNDLLLHGKGASATDDFPELPGYDCADVEIRVSFDRRKRLRASVAPARSKLQL
jgi:hypothetical protein